MPSDSRIGARLGARVAATLAVVALVVSVPAAAQRPAGPDGKAEQESAKDKEKEKDKGQEKPRDKESKKETAEREPAEPVVTRHEVTIGGRALKYSATAGKLPITDGRGTTEANIFFIAYTVDDGGGKGDEEAGARRSTRPLMFSFNGGPGSSSVWLHLGALGPKRVPLPDDASYPLPPFKLVDNHATWLDRTDLVFIDPVGTGYSRAAKPELNKKFHGLRGDIASVGEFIRLYLTRYERWGSPLYLVGESYGTTRAAGLSDHLFELGIALNGIALISTVLDFQTLEFTPGNDLPYVLFLPSYTAAAWYHKKLPDDLQSDLKKTLSEAERWADTTYRQALAKGDRLPDDERRSVLKEMARYTGLSREFLDASDLRVRQAAFCKELLRSGKRTVGRLDSRYKGIDPDAAGPSPGYDPSMAVIRPPYTSTFAQYVRGDLGYNTDLTYHILGSAEISGWDWGTGSGGGGRGGSGYPETYRPLRDAMAKNPHMKLFVGQGYYDLATPYLAADYTLSHMKLDPTLRPNVRVRTYEAGHMMYVHTPSLEKLKRDVTAFLDDANGSAGP
jgi:carboxypeptidase C (cathepsin A)